MVSNIILIAINRELTHQYCAIIRAKIKLLIFAQPYLKPLIFSCLFQHGHSTGLSLKTCLKLLYSENIVIHLVRFVCNYRPSD